MSHFYEQFSQAREDIPANYYEVAVFLDRAMHHLWNRGDRDSDAFIKFMEARDANHAEWMKVTA